MLKVTGDIEQVKIATKFRAEGATPRKLSGKRTVKNNNSGKQALASPKE